MVHEETHTKLFNHKKLAANLFSFVCTGCVGRIVVCGFFRAAHLLLDEEQRRQYFDFDCWSQRALERNKNLWRNRFYSEANDGE